MKVKWWFFWNDSWPREGWSVLIIVDRLPLPFIPLPPLYSYSTSGTTLSRLPKYSYFSRRPDFISSPGNKIPLAHLHLRIHDHCWFPTKKKSIAAFILPQIIAGMFVSEVRHRHLSRTQRKKEKETNKHIYTLQQTLSPSTFTWVVV